MYKRIRDLREDNDLTQNDIANYLKVYRSTYAKWEDGTNKIPLEKLDMLSIKYNVSLDYLIGITNIKRDYNIKPFNQNKFLLRLKNERKKRNLSQLSIANILDITKATYSKYELGIITPHIDKIIILADFYKITLDYLVGKRD